MAEIENVETSEDGINYVTTLQDSTFSDNSDPTTFYPTEEEDEGSSEFEEFTQPWIETTQRFDRESPVIVGIPEKLKEPQGNIARNFIVF